MKAPKTMNELWDLWVEEEQLCKAIRLTEERIKKQRQEEKFKKELEEFNALFGSTDNKKELQKNADILC